MLDEKQKLQEIIRLGNEMADIKDLDILMERILREARLFVNADAGSIYIINDGRLEFTYTQNETLRERTPDGRKLVYNTFSLPIDNNTIAGYVANNGIILNIADVYRIPSDAPYSFGKEFDKIASYTTRSMLTVPLKTHHGRTMGVLQIINAQDGTGGIVPFFDQDVELIKYFASNAAISMERAQMTRVLLLRMIGLAELRDPKETGPHVNRVAAYSTELYEAWARRRTLSEKEIENNKDILRMAAMLHDVGKVGISDLILQKPGKLTYEEFEMIKQHSLVGAQLFSNPRSDFDVAAAEVALNHHERWDGSGYPGHIDARTGRPVPGHTDQYGKPVGKRGNEIPLLGRIVAIADVYDALSSKRSYKDAWKEEDVVEELKNQAGKQFDPELLEIFQSIHDVIISLKQRYPDPE